MVLWEVALGHNVREDPRALTHGLLHTVGICLASSLIPPSSRKWAQIQCPKILPQDSAPLLKSPSFSYLFMAIFRTTTKLALCSCCLVWRIRILSCFFGLFIQTRFQLSPTFSSLLVSKASITDCLLGPVLPTSSHRDGRRWLQSKLFTLLLLTHIPAMAILTSVLEHSRMLT